MRQRLPWAAIVAGLVVAVGPASAQTTTMEWIAMADAAYRAGDYAESAAHYAEAIAAGTDSPSIHYNAACSAALAGASDDAFEFLLGALEEGWKDVDHLTSDSDLSSLHGDPRWERAVEAAVANDSAFMASIEEPTLRRELLEMRRIDQAARRGEAIPELDGRDMMNVDAVNTARMKAIVDEFGWPSERLVGDDGARAAWLLVQHADADVEFQRACLDRMLALPAGEVSAIDIAYLTDRVRVNSGEPQVYGTQFWTVDGESVPRPIEDEAAVDERRAAVGLEPLAAYAARLRGR